MNIKNIKTNPLSRQVGTSPLTGRSKFGFTLVELLVVISIIGILTMIGAVAYSGAQRKARDTQRKTELDALSKALIMYYNDNGVFPALTLDELFASDKGFTGPGEIVYMAEEPVDPKSDATNNFVYVYKYNTTTKKEFELFANLENKSDSKCEANPYKVDGKGFCYGISSPNTGLISWPKMK